MGLLSNIFAFVTVTLVLRENFVEGAAPAWGATTGTASVAEDAAANAAITITATPSLTNTPTSVEILSTSTATSQQAFAVALDGTTAITFKVLAAGVLDRESAATMTVNIRATNADGSTTGNDLVVTVTITDANDNAPVFNPSSVCVAMALNTLAGDAVHTMGATDADTAANGLGNTAYTFDPTSTEFDIAGATGAITLATGQTLTASSSYTLTVKATDSGTPAMSGTASVRVCVGDNCCDCSSGFVIHGTVALIVLGLLSLIL